MSSLVLELQREAMNANVGTATLLRMALVVATKLGLTEMRRWCESELHGYSTGEVPSYRKLTGELKAFNPYRGWIPVMLSGHARLADVLSTTPVALSVGELEDLVKGGDSTTLRVTLPQEVLEKIFGSTREFQMGMIPHLFISSAGVRGILEEVRNAILEWSLRLEKDGIRGDDMSFSPKELAAATTATYQINHFTGVLGNVQADQFQIGNSEAVYAELERAGVSANDCAELKDLAHQAEKAPEKEKASLVARIGAWIAKNPKTSVTWAGIVKTLLSRLGST